MEALDFTAVDFDVVDFPAVVLAVADFDLVPADFDFALTDFDVDLVDFEAALAGLFAELLAVLLVCDFCGLLPVVVLAETGFNCAVLAGFWDFCDPFVCCALFSLFL